MEAKNYSGKTNGSATMPQHYEHYEHSMGQLLVEHPTALSVACLASIILGLPLSLNMLWHLRVATNASGRGVLRDRVTFWFEGVQHLLRYPTVKHSTHFISLLSRIIEKKEGWWTLNLLAKKCTKFKPVEFKMYKSQIFFETEPLTHPQECSNSNAA